MDSTVTPDPALNAPPIRAYVVLGIGILAVSMAAIFIRLGQGEGVPSPVIAASRLLIAAVILTPLTLRRYRSHLRALNRQQWGLLTVSGVFLAAHFATWVSSLEYTTVLISVVIVTTTPIWVGILEVVFLRARLSRGIVAGLLIALAGGLMIGLSGEVAGGATDDGTLIGGGLSLIGALTVAVYLIIGRKLRSTLPLLPYVWSVYGIAALTLVSGSLLAGYSFTGYSAEGYLWVLALGLIPQLIGHSSLNYALAYLPATYISVATQLEPLGGAVIALILFREQPTAMQIVGSLVILVGVLMATLLPRRDAPANVGESTV